MVKTKHNISSQMVVDTQVYARHLAHLLLASPFSDEDKNAWARLVPNMSLEELGKLDRLLQASVQARVAHELEDLLMSIQAVQHKQDLSLLAMDARAEAALDEIESRIKGKI